MPIAFCSPVLWAISTHFDKYLVERYFKHGSVAVFLVFTALVGLLLLPCIVLFKQSVFALSATSIAVIGLSGLLYMAAMYFYLASLQFEEASIVAPFFQAGPVFAYALAYTVLHELPTSGQLWGSALIIVGSTLLSVDLSAERPRVKLRLVWLMFACALALAVSSVIFKIYAIHGQFWPTTFWIYAGEALFGFGTLAIGRYRREFIAIVRSSPIPLLALNGMNEVINLGGSLTARWALVLGPLGPIQAIGSTTTLFVFLFGILISLVSPGVMRENLGRRELLQKGSAVMLAAVGVALINGG